MSTPIVETMAGHWVLARLGKRVLRPGGRFLTRWMLENLNLTKEDRVLELAPGIGVTAHEVLRLKPKEYIAVDSDENAIKSLKERFNGKNREFKQAMAQETGLPSESVSVAFGEAFLTMQSNENKKRILAEMFRVLEPGGRFGFHEMCFLGDERRAQEVRRELSRSIRVNAKPLAEREWIDMVQAEGFVIEARNKRPMTLLRVGRIIEDEGIFGALRIIKNALQNPRAIQRALAMRSTFVKYENELSALSMVAHKPTARR